jgi:NAD+ kinase
VSSHPAPRRVALVVHPTRDVDEPLATIAAWAAEHGLDVVQLTVPGSTHRAVAPAAPAADGDLIIALGGDGTVLSALRASATTDAPVLGVACGSLGALSAVTSGALDDALERVWRGDWSPRALPALAVRPEGAGVDWAVNDVVVNRRGAGQLVVDLIVDDELYVRMSGDGVIVATTIGSAAYSMAAGGPILVAGTAAFVCTPLAMHGGSAPPLVVPARATVTIDVHPGFVGYAIEIDGHQRELQALRYQITLDEHRVTLVTLAAGGRGLGALRDRALITDSPRVLARDRRAAR